MFKAKKPSTKGGPHIFITTAKGGPYYTNGSYAIDLSYVRELPPEFALAAHKAKEAGQDHTYSFGIAGADPSTGTIAFNQLWYTDAPETVIKPSFNVVMDKFGDPHRRSFTAATETEDENGQAIVEIEHRVYLSEPYLQNIQAMLGKATWNKLLFYLLENLTFKQPADNPLGPVRVYVESGEQVALIMPIQVR